MVVTALERHDARAHHVLKEMAAYQMLTRLEHFNGFRSFTSRELGLLRRELQQMAMVIDEFRFELEYFVTGWTAYALIAIGLLFFVPVVLSIGRNPDSRLYPRSRAAYEFDIPSTGCSLPVPRSNHATRCGSPPTANRME